MKEWRIYVIDLNDVDENIGLQEVERWSDEQVIEVSERQGLVYSLQGFASDWNYDNIVYPEFSYMRILEVNIRNIIGYQVIDVKTEDIIEGMYDHWIFESSVEAERWGKFFMDDEPFKIRSIWEGDMENAFTVTFEEMVIDWALSHLQKNIVREGAIKNDESRFGYVLGFLNDNGLPKPCGWNIAERILQRLEL